MDIRDFKAGKLKNGAGYKFFLPEKINHSYLWARELSLEGVARRERWDYPLDALREAVINALVHRDYLDTSSSVKVRIYDDQIILSNPKKLMPPLTIEQLKQKHSGRQRNPLVAAVFYYANLIESWGYGTLKMIELCKKQNLPEPEFVERKEGN